MMTGGGSEIGQAACHLYAREPARLSIKVFVFTIHSFFK
jgi:hypothetical protein